MRKELNLEMLMEDVKMLTEFGFTQEQAMSMAREKQGFEPLATSVAVAKQEVEEPAPKYYFPVKYSKGIMVKRAGKVCEVNYATVPKECVPQGVHKGDTASVLWHVNNRLIMAEFGDKVEFKEPTKGADPAYVCSTEKVAKELEKFELAQGITKEQWNAWVDLKVEKTYEEIERLESLKLKDIKAQW